MEASWLFDMPIDRVDVVVHRESIIHSMVQFQDNSVLAQLGVPDMRIPIQYALTYPKRLRSPVKELDLTELGALTFFPPDEENFLCLKACKQAMILGDGSGGGKWSQRAGGRTVFAEKISFWISAEWYPWLLRGIQTGSLRVWRIS